MSKPDVKEYLERAIQDCWDSQRALLDEDSIEYREIEFQIAAYQDVYSYLTGDEFTGEDDNEDDDGEKKTEDGEDKHDEDDEDDEDQED